MAGFLNSTLWTKSSGVNEVASYEINPHIILETPPPEVVDTISKYFCASLEQNEQTSELRIESGSDSGDSLFITQKDTVPEVVRSQKRCRSRSTSEPAPAREPEEEECEEDNISQRESISSSTAISSTYSKGRKRQNRTPRKYSFPFIGRTCSDKDTCLGIQQNAIVESSAIGGFFKCVKALTESTKRPQSYMDETKALSPLSTEEKRWANDGMNIVARNRFAKPSKQKCSQTWYTSQTPKVRDSTSATPPRTQTTDIQVASPSPRIPQKPRYTSQTPEDSDSTNATPPRRQTTDMQMASPSPRISQKPQERSRTMFQRGCKLTGVQVCPESRKTDKGTAGTHKHRTNPSHQQGEEEHPSNGNVVVSLTNGETTRLQGSPVQCTQPNRVTCPSVTEPQPDVCHVNLDHTRPQPAHGETHDPLSGCPDLVSESGAREKVKEKKSKKRKIRERGDVGVELPSGQEGSEGQDAAGPRVNIEISQVDGTPGQTEEDRLEPFVPQSSDAVEPRVDNDEDAITQRTDYKSKEKKKKKKKDKSAVRVIMMEGVDAVEPKEKRRDLLSHDDSESVELFQDEDAISQRNDYQPKEKKRKKDKSAVHVIMTKRLKKDKPQNLRLDSELIDCVGVEKPSSQAIAQDSGTVLCSESAAISQRTPEANIDSICLEHKPGISKTHDPLSSSADLVGDSVYGGGALEKVKEKKSKKKKKREKGGIEGVELTSGQEGSEGQDTVGPCVNIEVSQVDRTPGQTEEDRLEPSVPKSSDTKEPREEKRRNLLSPDDPESVELFQDENVISQRNDYQPKEKKKKRKKDKSAVHVIVTEHLEKDKSQNLSLDSELMDCVRVVEKPSSQAIAQESGIVLHTESAAISQRTPEANVDSFYLEHEPGIRDDPLSSSADLIGDSVYGGGALEKVKEKKSKKKKKREKGGIGEGVELPSGQEGSEGQDAAGPCVNIEVSQVDRTPGQTEEDSLEPSVPQSSDAVEPRKEKRRNLLSHDDSESVELFQDEDATSQRNYYQPKEKKKRKKDKSAVHVIMTKRLKKDKPQNLSLDSELIDCVGVVEKLCSQAIPQNSGTVLCSESAAISQRIPEGNVDSICLEREPGISKTHDPLSSSADLVGDSVYGGGALEKVKEKKSKKKKKREKGGIGEGVETTLDDDVNLEQPNVRMQLVSGVPESPLSTHGRKKRNKKKKTVGETFQDAIELSRDAVARPPNDDIETQKKRGEKRREITEEREKEKSLNLNLESQLVEFTGRVEKSSSSTLTPRPGLGLRLGSTEMGQKASESTIAKDTEDFMEPRKRKKHKKKQALSSNDDSNVGQEEENVDNAHPEGAITLDENLGLLRKKKRKKTSVVEEETNIAKVPQHTEINPKLNNDATCQKTIESSVEQYVKQTTRKKKQKKRIKKPATRLSEDTAAQSDDSVSVQEKEKSINGAFLVADPVEKYSKTYRETRVPTQTQLVPERNGHKRKKTDRPGTSALETEPVGDVESVQEPAAGSNDASLEKKRKRKKKSSTLEDTVVKDYRDFDEPNTEYQSSASESKSCSEAVDAGLKRKRKHKKKDKEFETPVIREGSAVDIEHSQTDEAVVLKKKRKYSCHDNKGADQMKNVRNAYELNAKTGAEHATNSSEAPGTPVSNAVEGKKRRGKTKSTDTVTPEGKSCARSVTLTEESQSCESKGIELQPHTKKKGKKRNKPATTLKGPAGEQAESNSIPPIETVCSSDLKKRPKKGKRKLYDRTQDYLGTSW